MPDASRNRIFSKLAIDLRSYDQNIVDQVIVSVEALYSYSMLKATLSSERDDPFIKNMLLNFRVAQDSPAL